MDCSSDPSLHNVSPPCSSELKSIRLCLICTTYPFSYDKYYCLFIFDPTQKLVGKPIGEFITKHPTIRIHPRDRMIIHAFHVSGSTLYMFESGDESGAKSVYTLDLSVHCVNLSLHLESHMAPIDLKEVDAWEECMVEAEEGKIRLKREHDMTGWKSDVGAAATPNGRYLMVFSGKLWANSDMHGDEDRCDFELYDLVEKSWTILPDFECKRFFSPRERCLLIRQYEFVSDHLFVITTRYGEFSLDIHRKCWDEYKADIDSGNEFYFTDAHVVRRDGVSVSTLPPLTTMPAYVFAHMKDPTLLQSEISSVGGMLKADPYQLSFCVAQTTVDKQTDFKAYLTFDLFLTNLAKHRRKEMHSEKKVGEQEKDIPTTKLNSFGIMLAQQEENLSWFEANALFQIRN